MEALQFSWWNVQGVWHFRGHNMSGRYAMHGWKVSRRYISAPTPLHARMPGDTAGVVLLGDTGKQTLGGRAWMWGGKGVKTFKNHDNVQCPFQRGKRGGFVCSARRVWQIWGAGCAVPPDFCTVFAAQHPAGAWKKEGRKRGNVPKTSDFLYPNLRTFEAKPRMFASKKSDVSPFPEGKCLKNVGKSP